MTINNSSNKITVAGNGSMTVFSFPFVGAAASDISVTYTSAAGQLLVLPASAYIVTLNAPTAGQIWGIGGSVQYPISGSAIPTGSSLTILRTVPLLQTVSLSNQGSSFPQSTETGLDLEEMQLQQIAEVQGRAISVAVSDPAPASLPPVAARANLAAGFDSSGNLVPIPNSGSPPPPPPSLVTNLLTPEDYGAAGNGSTDDTIAMTAAVAASLATGRALYLGGSYRTTSSIPSLHSIRYLGKGKVLRSSGTFTPCPLPTDVNIFYVATSGLDTNDGLSTSQPFLTGQAAVNAITNYGASTPGEWVVNFAAGTYSAGITFPENLMAGPLRSATPIGNRIFLLGVPVGGSPNVPTTIFDGGSSPPTNYGLLLNGANKVSVQDIKFTNWNATTQTYGIDVADLSFLETFNVHFAHCSYGIIARQSRVYVNGGIVDTCSQSGLTALNACVISWVGITVSNCPVYGINVGESSTGHFDTGTIKVCGIGAYVVEQAHVQISGTIQQCTTGINVLDASYLDGGITWGTAGLANTINVLRYAGGIEVNSMATFPAPLRMAASETPVSVGTGNTAETTLVASLAVVLNGTFQNGDRSLTLRLWGAWGGNNGTRTLRFKAAGTTMATLAFTGTTPSAATGNFDAEFIIDASASAAQVANSSLRTDIAPNYAAQRNAAGAIDFFSGSPVTLSLTGQCSNSSDQIVVDRWEVWLT